MPLCSWPFEHLDALTHRVKHRFCPTSPSGEPLAAINLRCVEGTDLHAIPVSHFDGRAQ